MKLYKIAAVGAVAALSLLFIFTLALKQRTISSFQTITSQTSIENSGTSEAKPADSVIDRQKIAENYGNIPLYFEPNLGQTDEQVNFIARGHGYSLFLTEREAVLSLQKNGGNKAPEKRSVVRIRIDGANPAPKSYGLDETAGKSNYFIGNEPEKWRTAVPNYERVEYESVYDGVDLVYYGSQQRLEYDFVVRPEADPHQIKLKFDGVKNAKIEEKTGDLLLETEVGELRQQAPVVYQNIAGERREIAGGYQIANSKFQIPNSKSKGFTVSFKLAEYDKSKELIIDPILAYGSYLGGNAFDEGRAITVDASGNAYVVGTAASRDFPTTARALKPVLLSRTDAPNSFWYDAFVTKINPNGTALFFSTYFGGRNGSEIGTGVALDAGGNILISGTTMAADFPTVNAYQNTFGGTDDAFAAKLNSTGSAIIYSTYLGGKNTDTGGKIAVDQSNGDAVYAGTASSPDFPTTAGAYKQKLCNSPQSCSGIFYSGSYLVKLTATGSGVYSTLFDAGIIDVTLDAGNNAVFGGTASAAFPATAGAFQTISSGGVEGFVAKMNPTGSAPLVYGTFLGGGLQSDRVKSIALDAAQNIYVTGQTQNTGFPTTPGAYDTTFNGNEDGFVTKLNPAGSALVYSTFLGGSGKDEPFAIGLGTDDSVFIAGETTSGANFPLRNSLLQTGSIFLTRLNADASALVFSTLLGQGGAYDLAVDANSGAYLTGHTTNVLVTPNAVQTIRGGDPFNSSSSVEDAFVMKIGAINENGVFYSISGTVTDQNAGFNNDTNPVVVTLSGTVSRIVNISYTGGQFSFGSLPAGGNYAVTVKKDGYETAPQSINFNNLGANQSGDFAILRNHAPETTITSPAHGTNYNAPASITIQASATDSDGDAISKVQFVAYNSATGNIPLGIDTTAPFEFTWTNVPVGTYALYAFPYDSHGLRGQTQNTVHVFVVDPSGANVSISNPTEGQNFAEGDYVPLGATVSSSVNLVEVRDQNNNLVGRMTASPWTTQWRVMTIGNYTLTATAFTQTGQQATSAPVNITVNPINHRISGRIFDNFSNNPLGNVTLNLVCPGNPNISRTTTTDSGGNYLFTDLGTTPNDSVTITPVAGNYSFAPPSISTGFLGYITNWTNQNFTATAQTQIGVALTSPTDGQIFTAPASINLAASASSGAGTITKVEFFRVQGAVITLLGTDTTAPFEFQTANIGAGNYTYFARATDSTNALAESERVTVTVRLQTINLSGRITNQAGNGVPNVEVYVSGEVADSVFTNANGNYIFNNLPGGSNYFITPSPANTITFTPVSRSYTNVVSNVTNIDFVASEPNQAPTPQFISPLNGAVYTLPAPIALNVAANDPDNNVSHLSVVANNGSSAITIAQTTANTINTLWQPTVPGNYILTAIVRDAGPVQITTQISITVNPPAPISISGRTVDRNSFGIDGATVELRDYPSETNVVATATTDANGNYTLSNIATFSSYVLRVSKPDYTFSPPKRIYLNLSASQTAVDFTGTLQVQPSDFDGDGISDIAVWRPSSGVWHIQRSNDNSYNALQFGGAAFGDVAVPGNYDGDKKTDYAVYRSGVWYIWQSSNGQVKVAQFGLAGDVPVAGDYDGDGKTDLAVWRGSTGVWYIWRSSDGGYDFRPFGLNGDTPLAGDYDGDGKADIAIWRGTTGVWYVQQSSDGGYRSYQFGLTGDVPLVGDFDGDKMADYTIFRPSNGVWYVSLSSNGSFKILQWGLSSDIPVPGDFDRDGKTDFGVFRPLEGNWYIFKSSTNSYVIQHFGADGDLPVPAAYR